MKWIRLWVDEIIRGTTFAELTLAEKGVWFSLLVLAGDGRNMGIVEMQDGIPFENAVLAKILHCSENELIDALLKLTKVNKIVIESDNRISIKNWSNYQTSYEKRKSSHRETRGEVDVEVDKTPYSPPFVNFWLVYPRKVCKAVAYGEWKRLNPNAITIQKILSSLKAQKQSDQWRESGQKYIPYPSTWLHQRRWEDEPESERKSW